MGTESDSMKTLLETIRRRRDDLDTHLAEHDAEGAELRLKRNALTTAMASLEDTNTASAKGPDSDTNSLP